MHHYPYPQSLICLPCRRATLHTRNLSAWTWNPRSNKEKAICWQKNETEPGWTGYSVSWSRFVRWLASHSILRDSCFALKSENKKRTQHKLTHYWVLVTSNPPHSVLASVTSARPEDSVVQSESGFSTRRNAAHNFSPISIVLLVGRPTICACYTSCSSRTEMSSLEMFAWENKTVVKGSENLMSAS